MINVLRRERRAKLTVVAHWDPLPNVEGEEDLSDETDQECCLQISGIRMYRMHGGLGL